jgi:hypothetical protein
LRDKINSMKLYMNNQKEWWVNLQNYKLNKLRLLVKSTDYKTESQF